MFQAILTTQLYRSALLTANPFNPHNLPKPSEGPTLIYSCAILELLYQFDGLTIHFLENQFTIVTTTIAHPR
jgi:hypothetical protein